MKRLLLLPFLCLMPSAQAMDYVKCEAMQKAMSRLRTRQSQLLDPSRHTASSREIFETCKHLRPSSSDYGTPAYREKYADYDQCTATVRQRFTSTPEFQAEKQELKQIPKRIAAVQADYNAAGCY